ncbi:acyl-CoA dehydrogenase [Gordonia sp. zg691]|uniref:acyl-CoA dehydrogenase family protein n=1 Tax=Gordonia jinghuaiqii TaxID=2758710 RepID=UPI001662476E|nr:acyl-CoA dehydrogenase family protein [Gordonia jinghuaiqii]MBD0859816.1 acyl-CoA dehydrogenase [Gordonia jinghuaiqii]
MDADDVAQVAESLRQALAADPTRARDSIEQFGWTELLDDEPKVAVATLFSLSGELLTTGSMLDEVMLEAVGLGDLGGATRVVLPATGGSRPPGQVDGDGSVMIEGIVAQGVGPVLLPFLGPEAHPGFAVAEVTPFDGDPLDPTSPWRLVRETVRPQQILDSPADAASAWEQMLAAGRRALAHELVGVSGSMEAMTVDHVRSREQFGTALGSFQAVKHQLADVRLWREVAVLSADAAWEDGGAVSASLAKAAAVRSSRTARTVCQQLLGGMGFTWEHDFHRYLRRALTIEPLLGNAADLHSGLGAALRARAVGHDLVSL